MTLTPTMLMLIDLIISNAIRAAMNRVSILPEAEIRDEIAKETARKAFLIEKIE